MVSDKKSEELHVLLVGNNPIELGIVQAMLHEIPSRKVVTVMAFDLRTIVLRLNRFKPDFVLIDDNIGKAELGSSVRILLRHRKTRRVPITMLKNSNYREVISQGADNYVLKANITGTSLYHALVHSIKFSQTLPLHHPSRSRKGRLAKLIG